MKKKARSGTVKAEDLAKGELPDSAQPPSDSAFWSVRLLYWAPVAGGICLIVLLLSSKTSVSDRKLIKTALIMHSILLAVLIALMLLV